MRRPQTHPTVDPRSTERGQIIVLFTLATMVVVGIVGLVLDGGSAFAQRRNQQNVADMSSLAAAEAYLNTTGATTVREAAANAAAQSLATANGFTDGSDGVSIAVGISSAPGGANVTVSLNAPHRNNFAAVLGMPTWGVSVTASAVATEKPNGAIGAMPLLFNAAAFPGAICNESAGTCVDEVYQLPGTGNEDVPQDATQFNWTVFCTANGGGNTNQDSDPSNGQNGCNANAQDVKQLIADSGTSTTVYLTDDIGPFDAGTKTTLFDDLTPKIGIAFPVPIVDSTGAMVGWAYFRLTSIEGAPDKVIRGHFLSPVNADKLVVKQGEGDASLLTGSYSIRLTN